MAPAGRRHSRIVSQGNPNAEVPLTQVLTEGSFDAIMWQMLQRKAEPHRPDHVRKILGRKIDDIGGSAPALSFTEFKVISSGYPLLLEPGQRGP